MNHAFRLMTATLILATIVSCAGQHSQDMLSSQNLSEDFNNDPPIYYKMPVDITSIDTSAGWPLEGQKILITGVAYQLDGKTPAPNIIVYYYQTDLSGRYTVQEEALYNMPKNNQGQTHGYIRGWVKTGGDGAFSIYTVRPGAYPNGREAAHIHLYVKEPSMSAPYYIDNVVFDDDALLTTSVRGNMANRGGSGVVHLVRDGDLFVGERDVILGLNVTGYTQN